MLGQQDPRVSVIIPTYNRSRYLSEAIQSVLTQTYGDFEIVIVDDGSTDDTASVVQVIDDPRLRYIHQPNAGHSVARNRGLAAARGELIAFLDDDDRSLPEKLAQQVAFLRGHPTVDVVAGGRLIVDQVGMLLQRSPSWLRQPDLTLHACLYACPLLLCAVLIRREMLQRLPSWFDPTMSFAEDTDFFIRLLQAGCRCAWQQEYVYVYRLHTDNYCRDAETSRRCFFRMLDKVFADPRLASDIRQKRANLYARYRLWAACQHYANREWADAQNQLMHAVDRDPGFLEGTPPFLIEYVAGRATGFRIQDPAGYVRRFFEHLPDSLAHLREYRKEALSILHMKRVFAAHGAGETPALEHWLLGTFYSPRWLRNRGVWSILARDIIGLPWVTGQSL